MHAAVHEVAKSWTRLSSLRVGHDWAIELNWTETIKRCFPSSSAGKESTCNAGDPCSIPESGISPGKGIGYPLQYSWASLVAQLVKNLPVMRETWVQSLGWEDPLEKGMAPHSCILAWRIPWTVYSPWGHKEWTQLRDFHLHFKKITR